MSEMDDILKKAVEAAEKATHFDSSGKNEAAIYLYREAALLLKNAASELVSQSQSLTNKAEEYSNRADVLENKQICDEKLEKKEGLSELGRANFLLIEALELDEDGEHEDAIEMYSNAVEFCVKVAKQPIEPNIKEKLRKLAEQALSRAEDLKGVNHNTSDPVAAACKSTPPSKGISPIVVPPLGFGNISSSKSSSTQDASHVTKAHPRGIKGLHLAGRASYSKEELDVLRHTTLINGREYVPFMSVDLKEKFAFSLPFTDKDGTLILSPKQKGRFSRWSRPEDICSDPKMIEVVDCFSIKQTCVSDCSFIASIAISALYEKRFKKRLITDIIYPKNRQGDPVYNPCGKYMIKLFINGIQRKVVIDDSLPSGKYGELLCSYSTNKNEFWISLIEKAYMKVMGGYDFPGSNSNIDLYSLTGWIPERISIHEKEFNKDDTFKKIQDRFHKGDCLVTVATGEMGDAVADRAGLVATHAYAMLDIREIKGKRLMMLKNPWSHLRWKGNFSELDQQNWTPEMCRLLNYDPKSAQMFDNGVFWIDYDSLCHFFDVFYMNWNPSLFSHTFGIHQSWSAGLGPAKDLYNIGENPQYFLDVQVGSASGAAVWILLTRHITDIEDFRNNKEYITLLVYKNDGKKVFYPFDPPPYIDGVRINSPHYLCKIVLKQPGTHRFTLVVSQYEKQHTIFYSIRAYATCAFSLNKIPNHCKYKHEERSKWAGITAGGCPNYPSSYKNNPIYQFRTESDLLTLRIELKAPKEIQIGFEIVCVDAKNTEAKGYFSKKRSGDYRSGFCLLEMENVPSGVYNIIPSTFYPQKEAPYYLFFFSSLPIKVSRLQ